MAQNQEYLIHEIDCFLKEQPRFLIVKKREVVHLSGYYFVNLSHLGFAVQMAYQVDILVPRKFPKKLPQVFYNKRLIPIGYDHCYSNGRLCLETDECQKDYLKKNPNLTKFLEIFLGNYLFGMEYYRKYSILPFGEWSHGETGVNGYLKQRNEFIERLRYYGSKRR
ncbi:MAG: hypothetical protein ACOYKC_08510 [Anaerolineaceae bacterium]|jgi:hypothetical protein